MCELFSYRVVFLVIDIVIQTKSLHTLKRSIYKLKFSHEDGIFSQRSLLLDELIARNHSSRKDGIMKHDKILFL
jgi:hypothetical protein